MKRFCVDISKTNNRYRSHQTNAALALAFGSVQGSVWIGIVAVALLGIDYKAAYRFMNVLSKLTVLLLGRSP